jgi:hypothetical protein
MSKRESLTRFQLSIFNVTYSLEFPNYDSPTERRQTEYRRTERRRIERRQTKLRRTDV